MSIPYISSNIVNWIKVLSNDTTTFLFWEEKFDFSEKRIDGLDNIHEELSQFVSTRYKYPTHRYNIQRFIEEGNRILKGIKRRLFI